MSNDDIVREIRMSNNFLKEIHKTLLNVDKSLEKIKNGLQLNDR